MNPLVLYCALSAAVNALTSFSLGLYVIATNPRPLASRTFFGFAMSVGFWSLCYTFWQTSAQPDQALFWTRALMAGAIFIPTFFIHFVITFLGIDSTKHRLVRLSYVLSAIFLCSDLTPLYISGVTERMGFNFWPIPGPFFHPFLLHFSACVIYAHFLMYRELQVTAGDRRNQIKYVFLGTLIGFGGGFTNFPLWYTIPIPPVGNALVALYVAMVAYAIARYRLLDVNVALMRMGVFTAVYIPLLILPFVLGKLFQPSLTALLGLNWWMVPMVAEAFFATLGLVAYRYVRQRAENRILADQRRYQQLLVAAAEEMLKIFDLRKLLRRIVGLVVTQVRLSYAAIYLQEQEGEPFRLQVSRGEKVELPDSFDQNDAMVHYLWALEGAVGTEELRRSAQTVRGSQSKQLAKVSGRLTHMKASVIIPAFLKRRLTGFMVLGRKTSGQMFTQDDLSTFGALAHQAAIAIQNARLYRRGVNLSKLEAADEQLSAMGHEMGNVLHIGTTCVGTLKEGLKGSTELPPREKLIEHLDRAERALLRGHDVIEDAKEYKRVSGQAGLHTVPLAQFIEEAVKKLQKRFEDSPNIRVILDLPENLPPVEGLATLPLLPLNLLAIPFWGLAASIYPEGGTIMIKGLADTQRNHVELIVADDTAESLRKYLENPNRVGDEAFPTRSRHGAFYYFVVKKTVSDHYGRLVVLDGPGPLGPKGSEGTNPGKGTTMLVQLPLKYTPPKPEEIEEEILGNPP